MVAGRLVYFPGNEWDTRMGVGVPGSRLKKKRRSKGRGPNGGGGAALKKGA